jgi:hypothetical protein
MSTELLEATTLEEDCFTTSLLLDLASEEEGFTEELDSFAFSSDELEFLESLEDEDWRFPLEAGMTEEEEDFDFSTEEEDFSLLEFFCELEEFLETSPLLELVSSQSSF